LLEQPDNVYDYAKKFFSYFNYQKDTIKYKPLVLSGCSGVGKVFSLNYRQGTLVKKLLQKYPDNFELSISYTTRNAREGEVHGREYYFVKKEDFEKVTYCFM
jgi:guanylate kinase